MKLKKIKKLLRRSEKKENRLFRLHDKVCDCRDASQCKFYPELSLKYIELRAYMSVLREQKRKLNFTKAMSTSKQMTTNNLWLDIKDIIPKEEWSNILSSQPSYYSRIIAEKLRKTKVE